MMRRMLCCTLLPTVIATRLQRPLARASVRHLRGGAVQLSTTTARPDIFDKFDLVSTEEVLEHGLTSSLYRHKQTGAEVLSIEADDDNKVFSANFRTLPKDDTG